MADDAGGFTCANGIGSPQGYSAACDACIQQNGCDAYCTCGADSNVDDAGMPTGCVGYVDCVITCVNSDPDAGIAGCAAICGGPDSGGTYSAQQQQEGQALLTALAGCQNMCQAE